MPDFPLHLHDSSWERWLERHQFAAQLRHVLVRRDFPTKRARARAFWHYIIRRHKYEICGSCGRPVGLVWMADDEVWLSVNGSEWGVMCIPCFDARALADGRVLYWRPVPQGVNG